MKLKEKEKAATAKLIADAISAQCAEFTIGKPGEKAISYVIVKEGILEVRKTKIGIFSRMKDKMDVGNVTEVIKTMAKVPGISNEVAKVKESLDNLPSAGDVPPFQLLTPKIPINIFYQIIQFFRDVYTRQHTEAAALIRWSQEKNEYYVEIPGGPDGKEQDLSGASVKYKPDPNNKDIIVMDIHSHHEMGAFFSGIDDADEQFTQLYGVVGNIDHSHPTASFRARMHGEDIAEPRVEDIFDVPAYPPTWMEKIKEPPKTFSTEVGDTGWEPPAGYSHIYGADEPPVTEHKWYERGMGESLADYARRMDKIKRGSRGSLPAPSDKVPAQKDGEADEEYFARLNGKKELPPTTGDVLNSDEVLTAQKEIWDVIENELLERAEIYQYRATLVALRDYLVEKLNDVSPGELRAWANS